MEKTLCQDDINFGKYKGGKLEKLLKDRNYSKWLLQQDWFKTNYEYLYNRIIEYEPIVYFVKPSELEDSQDFLESYKYFNLIPVENLKIILNDDEVKCYKFYFKTIKSIKQKILDRKDNLDKNIYDIKAPTNWLKKFEDKYGLKREQFKEFINSYDLPNIPYVIEDIKGKGGIEYKGAKSFIIAKENSKKQENFWEEILKQKYGENISPQYKYEKCIFDFLNISTNTIFECKLSLKDFSEEQYRRYLVVLKMYNIIYIIGYDCVIDMNKKIIYTTDVDKYKIQLMCFDDTVKIQELIKNFKIVKIDKIENCL